MVGSLPATSYSMAPPSRGAARKAVWRVRKSVISSSGLGPASSFLKIFRMARPPNTTEVLLCSVLTRATWRGGSGSMSARAGVARKWKRPWRPASTPPARICSTSAAQKAGSSRASATVQPGGPALVCGSSGMQ